MHLKIAALMMVFGVSCMPAVAPSPHGRVPAATVVEVAKTLEEETASTKVERKKVTDLPALSFAATQTRLETTCMHEPVEETQLAWTDALAARNECLAKELHTLREATIASLPEEQRSTFTTFENGNERIEQDVCWMSEESLWVDFEGGVRDDGSLRGSRWLACVARIRMERAFLLETIKARDVAGFREHVDAVGPRAKLEFERLGTLQSNAIALTKKPVPPMTSVFAARPIDVESRAEYIKRIRTIFQKSHLQAASLCKAFDGLDGQGCEASINGWYANFGEYGNMEEER